MSIDCHLSNSEQTTKQISIDINAIPSKGTTSCTEPLETGIDIATTNYYREFKKLSFFRIMFKWWPMSSCRRDGHLFHAILRMCQWFYGWEVWTKVLRTHLSAKKIYGIGWQWNTTKSVQRRWVQCCVVLR